MKIAIIAPVAFVVGLAGGVALTPAPAAPPVAGDSTHLAEPPPAPVTAPPVEGEHAIADPSVTAAPEDARQHDSLPAPAFDAVRLAAIFDKLPPADVPPLMSNFTDTDAGAVLRKMSLEHATAVLAAMPKERSTALSRYLLATGRPE